MFLLTFTIFQFFHFSLSLLMESSDPIFLFLKKMRLDKHYSKFISNPHFKIKSLEDCKRLLSNLNYLEDIGLSPAEVNRFKRLFENALKVTNVYLLNSVG